MALACRDPARGEPRETGASQVVTRPHQSHSSQGRSPNRLSRANPHSIGLRCVCVCVKSNIINQLHPARMGYGSCWVFPPLFSSPILSSVFGCAKLRPGELLFRKGDKSRLYSPSLPPSGKQARVFRKKRKRNPKIQNPKIQKSKNPKSKNPCPKKSKASHYPNTPSPPPPQPPPHHQLQLQYNVSYAHRYPVNETASNAQQHSPGILNVVLDLDQEGDGLFSV